MTLKFKRTHPDAIAPTRGSVKASGLDLSSLVDTILKPGETKIIPTGIIFDIPEGYEIQVRARSGLSAKTSLRVANGIGTVDQDFTGQVGVIMWNAGPDTMVISRGDRIAQAVLCPVVLAEPHEVAYVRETERGSNGYGSTGI